MGWGWGVGSLDVTIHLNGATCCFIPLGELHKEWGSFLSTLLLSPSCLALIFSSEQSSSPTHHHLQRSRNAVFQVPETTHHSKPCSDAQSCPTLRNPMDCSTPGFPPLSFPRICSNSCPLSHRLSHPTISFSVIPFSSCLQSFPASGSFPMSQLFASGGQNIAASASASVLLMNIQEWFPLQLTGLISMVSKGFLRVLSSTTAQKHQFFSTCLSLWSNSHIHIWLLEKLWLEKP